MLALFFAYTSMFTLDMDEAPSVRLYDVHSHQGRKNDVIFCGTEAQQHVVFFHGDVQVSEIHSVWSNDLKLTMPFVRNSPPLFMQ